MFVCFYVSAAEASIVVVVVCDFYLYFTECFVSVVSAVAVKSLCCNSVIPVISTEVYEGEKKRKQCSLNRQRLCSLYCCSLK